MPTLNAVQIHALAVDAGFTKPGQAVTMTAIALAESGGDTDAHALTSKEDSRGLWQINARAHPEISGNLYDARTNARAAKIVYDKQGLGAWSVFTTEDPRRTYRRFLPDALSASGNRTSIADILKALPVAGGILTSAGADAAGSLNPLQGIEGVTQAIGGGVSLAAKAGTWLVDPRNLLRIAYVIVGGTLLIAALVVVVAPVAKPVVKTAAKAADIAL